MKWLSRRIGPDGPHLCLCLSEDEYLKVVRKLKAPNPREWLANNAHATAHAFFHESNGLCLVVCLDLSKNFSLEDVAGLLAHEATHVWQEHVSHIGEHAPGKEQEAYAIQAVTGELFGEYLRRLAALNMICAHCNAKINLFKGDE